VNFLSRKSKSKSKANQTLTAMIGINALAWLSIHLVPAWVITRLPLRFFNAEEFPFKSMMWERDGFWYESALRIKRWKKMLPDGAPFFFGGFSQKKISSRESAYLRRFASETCRGEFVHMLVLCATPLFFIWNRGWAAVVNVAYAIAANIPCILSLRYNRMRILRMLAKAAVSARKDEPYART
jgi:glycosyl-4,4'-diaponeurosporenoate acyltransferase